MKSSSRSVKFDESQMNQATTYEKMIKKVKQLAPQFATGAHLKKYDPDTTEQFREMYVQAKNDVIYLCEKEMDKAAKEGKKYKRDFKKDKGFATTQIAFKFFAKYELHMESQRFLFEFNKFTEQQAKWIESQKNIKKLRDDQKAIYDLEYRIFQDYHRRDYQSLIECMIDAQNIIEGYRIMEGVDLKSETKKFQKILLEVIKDLQLSNYDFFEFINELRRMDVDDRNTKRVLTGRLKPHILVDIIFSNKWDEDQKQMVMDDTCFYELNIGKQRAANGNAKKHGSSTQIPSPRGSPRVATLSSMDNSMEGKQPQTLSKTADVRNRKGAKRSNNNLDTRGIFSVAPTVQEASQQEGRDFFQFILQDKGFRVLVNGKYLLMQQEKFQDNKKNSAALRQDMVFQMLGDPKHVNAGHDSTSIWTLNSLFRENILKGVYFIPPQDEEDFENDSDEETGMTSRFYIDSIQVASNGQNMRLTHPNGIPSSFSGTKHYTTVRGLRGYADTERTLWTVKKYTKQ